MDLIPMNLKKRLKNLGILIQKSYLEGKDLIHNYLRQKGLTTLDLQLMEVALLVFFSLLILSSLILILWRCLT